MKTIQKIFWSICKSFDYASRILFTIVFSITFFLSMARYLFHYSPIWGEEVTTLAMCWLFMLTSITAHRDDRSFRIHMFQKNFLPKIKIIVRLIEDVLVTAVMCIVIPQTLEMVRLGANQKYMGIPLSYAHLRLAMLVMFIGYVIVNIERYVMMLAHIEIEPVLKESDSSEQEKSAGKTGR